MKKFTFLTEKSYGQKFQHLVNMNKFPDKWVYLLFAAMIVVILAIADTWYWPSFLFE